MINASRIFPSVMLGCVSFTLAQSSSGGSATGQTTSSSSLQGTRERMSEAT
jgi:hypothetical protein